MIALKAYYHYIFGPLNKEDVHQEFQDSSTPMYCFKSEQDLGRFLKKNNLERMELPTGHVVISQDERTLGALEEYDPWVTQL